MAKAKVVTKYTPEVQAKIDRARNRVKNVLAVWNDESAEPEAKVEAVKALQTVVKNLKTEVRGTLKDDKEYAKLLTQASEIRKQMNAVIDATPLAMERRTILAVWAGYRAGQVLLNGENDPTVVPELSAEDIAVNVEDDDDDDDDTESDDGTIVIAADLV